MCRGKKMNVLVMDVEGTDGRERGEDQVPSCNSQFLFLVIRTCDRFRTSSESQLSSPSPLPRCSSSTCGNTKSACIRVQTWACSRRCLRLTWGCSANPPRMGVSSTLISSCSCVNANVQNASENPSALRHPRSPRHHTNGEPRCYPHLRY